MNNTIISRNTAYYRRNKIQKKVEWKCDKCNYTTTGPKICLQNHIYSKHTPEDQKPYLCGLCKLDGKINGFAQKAFLNSHLEKIHKIKIEKPGKEIAKYIIKRGNILSRNKKTTARIDWYVLKNEITKEELLEKGYNLSQVQYDTRSNYIITESILKKT